MPLISVEERIHQRKAAAANAAAATWAAAKANALPRRYRHRYLTT